MRMKTMQYLNVKDCCNTVVALGHSHHFFTLQQMMMNRGQHFSVIITILRQQAVQTWRQILETGLEWKEGNPWIKEKELFHSLYHHLTRVKSKLLYCHGIRVAVHMDQAGQVILGDQEYWRTHATTEFPCAHMARSSKSNILLRTPGEHGRRLLARPIGLAKFAVRAPEGCTLQHNQQCCRSRLNDGDTGDHLPVYFLLMMIIPQDNEDSESDQRLLLDPLHQSVLTLAIPVQHQDLPELRTFLKIYNLSFHRSVTIISDLQLRPGDYFASCEGESTSDHLLTMD